MDRAGHIPTKAFINVSSPMLSAVGISNAVTGDLLLKEFMSCKRDHTRRGPQIALSSGCAGLGDPAYKAIRALLLG